MSYVNCSQGGSGQPVIGQNVTGLGVEPEQPTHALLRSRCVPTPYNFLRNMSVLRGIELPLPSCRTSTAPFKRVNHGRGHRAARNIQPAIRASADDDHSTQDTAESKKEKPLVSGRRLLLLAGAASVASALPRWVMQTLDARDQDRLDNQSMNRRFYELFSSDAAQAATLVEERSLEAGRSSRWRCQRSLLALLAYLIATHVPLPV